MAKFLTFTAIVATAVVGYAVYFDYTRRTNPAFRKSLKKKSVKQKKIDAEESLQSRKSKLEAIKTALNQDLEASPIPSDLAQKEEFFMQQVALGEQLAVQPSKKIEAALCFYKALVVYPNPTDILGIYQRSVPEDVYEIVIMMIAVKPPAAVTSILGEGGAGAGATAAEHKPSEADLD
ncbi:mitochondrial import receptor subunit tom20 [Yamadazyma tenuis]|uniref:Mitochondrial import receptor subunit TOM20 n=1 Tax=Candida tenuis (strain ATCC 10573 / BCRC 21748 / CBS 615 / JCM 9827 / NBRC 10315 / NRRL Y-1498 / VKM Y-70) TaxID=590646 RepID=G3B2F6_CANTC|nr:protein import receptor MAS20 [Yamadazyma tenuis ATCC 10573]EGV64662.1 protein import receptor MAS20 [Yamadazyma tenuis ATCC 10573]WEJ97449.1 mitochondrial import receptor subunit tom20 [Yamadazyma tenuis]